MNKIQGPITFNAHKHHFQSLKWQIEEWKKQSWSEVQKESLCLGENLFDFYIGELTVENICNECLKYFKGENITEITTFKKWLGKNEYQKIELSDSSQWVIKQGINSDRYIHIHPGKYSRHTLRIRAVTLKTVVALQVQSAAIKESMKENLHQVNYIRKNYLKLSPIKSLSYDKGIFKIWQLFEEN